MMYQKTAWYTQQVCECVIIHDETMTSCTSLQKQSVPTEMNIATMLHQQQLIYSIYISYLQILEDEKIRC